MKKAIELKNNKPTRAARANRKNNEKKVEIKALERKGKCRYVKTTDIRVGTTVRLVDEVIDNKVSKKFKLLEKSIITNGILTPIMVKKDETSDTYTIIDGYRRFKVAQLLGIKKLQVIYYDDIDDKDEMLSIVANSNQKALTAIELGVAYKKLIDRGAYSSNRELADALGTSEGTIGTKINNLKMDKRIIEDLIKNSTITDQKVLKAIRTIEKIDEEGQSEKQWEVYSYIKENNLNRKDVLEYIKEQKGTVEIKRYVKLESNHIFNVMIDTSGLDEAKVSRIEELLAEIEELRQQVEA